MRRLLATTLLALGVGLGVWLAFSTRGRPIGPQQPAEQPKPQAEAPAEANPDAPAAPRVVPIVGRALDASLKPWAGLEVACGDEKQVTAPDGTFRFEPADRGGWRPLAIRNGGTELARWDSVFVGGSEVAPPPAENPPSRPDAEPDRIRWTFNLADGLPAGAAPGQESAGWSAQVSSVLVEDWGTTGLIRITGITNIPDGAHLDAALMFDTERLAASVDRAEAHGGAFRARIRLPETFPLQSGTYDLEVTFNVSLEDPDDLERWRKAAPQAHWDEGEGVTLKREIFTGDLAEAEANLRATEEYYRENLETLTMLRKVLLFHSEDARRLAAGWDPKLLEARATSAEAWFGDPLIDRSGKLDLASWRRFIDEGWRPELLKLLERHSKRTSNRFRGAEDLLGGMIRRMLLLSRIESTLLYRALGKQLPQQDRFLDVEEPEGDREILLQILDKEMAAFRRYTQLTTPR